MTEYSWSPRLLEKLEGFESFRDKPYKDGGGLWTVGYGQLCGEHDYPNGISKDDAAKFVTDKLDSICVSLENRLPGLSQCQVDALCLFVYNIGSEAFTGSHVYELLRQHSYKAFLFWTEWIHDAKGNIEAGLVSRRLYETGLFIWGIY